jgi:hypothetical protein
MGAPISAPPAGGPRLPLRSPQRRLGPPPAGAPPAAGRRRVGRGIMGKLSKDEGRKKSRCREMAGMIREHGVNDGSCGSVQLGDKN